MKDDPAAVELIGGSGAVDASAGFFKFAFCGFAGDNDRASLGNRNQDRPPATASGGPAPVGLPALVASAGRYGNVEQMICGATTSLSFGSAGDETSENAGAVKRPGSAGASSCCCWATRSIAAATAEHGNGASRRRPAKNRVVDRQACACRRSIVVPALVRCVRSIRRRMAASCRTAQPAESFLLRIAAGGSAIRPTGSNRPRGRNE